MRENGFNSESSADVAPPHPKSRTAREGKRDKGGSRARPGPGLRRCPRWMRTPAGRPGQAGDPGEPVQPPEVPPAPAPPAFR